MPIADLPHCVTEAQILEAIAKPIAYTLSPTETSLERLVRRVIGGNAKMFGMNNHQDDRAAALKFCQDWAITMLWQHGDPATGFEALLFRWKRSVYLVVIGSDDPTDWKRNLKDEVVGLTAYRANLRVIRDAIGLAVAESPDLIGVLGHSLGGSIAQFIAADFLAVRRCFTYQTAAVPTATIQAAQFRVDSLDARHYLHPSDVVFPVSRRRCDGGLIPGKVTTIGDPVRGADRIKAHTMMLTLV